MGIRGADIGHPLAVISCGVQQTTETIVSPSRFDILSTSGSCDADRDWSGRPSARQPGERSQNQVAHPAIPAQPAPVSTGSAPSHAVPTLCAHPRRSDAPTPFAAKPLCVATAMAPSHPPAPVCEAGAGTPPAPYDIAELAIKKCVVIDSGLFVRGEKIGSRHTRLVANRAQGGRLHPGMIGNR